MGKIKTLASVVLLLLLALGAGGVLTAVILNAAQAQQERLASAQQAIPAGAVAQQAASETTRGMADAMASATKAQSAAATKSAAQRATGVYAAGAFSTGETTTPDGLKLLPYTLDHGVKVFHLTTVRVHWKTGDGQTYEAWTYNGAVPGPTIRVNEGDRVRIMVKNLLPEGTTVHWHGLEVPNAMDGVPMVTQKPIMPNQTFTYEFTATPAGTHMYHTHMHTLLQEPNGLYGPFIVLPRHTAAQHIDREFTMMIADGPLGFIINGKSFPATPAFNVKLGDWVHIRIMNVGDMAHPFHMHGYDFALTNKDGQPLPQASTQNTVDLNPGDTDDLVFHADRPGVWVFHCHILSHVEQADGTMYGMIQAIVIK